MIIKLINDNEITINNGEKNWIKLLYVVIKHNKNKNSHSQFYKNQIETNAKHFYLQY